VGVRVDPEMEQSPEGVKLRLPTPEPPEVVSVRVEPKATVVSEEMRRLAWFALSMVRVAVIVDVS
jgi:hypothetical protein